MGRQMCGKVDIIFSVFLPASQRRCDQPRGHGLRNNVKLRSGPEYEEILTRQLLSFDFNSFLCECCFLISPTNTKHNKFNLSQLYFSIVSNCSLSLPYLYFIKVESLAKELAAREISVSTIGLTT